MYLSYLECPECGGHFDPAAVQSYCRDCASPLIARYDLADIAAELTPEIASLRPRGIWRWKELLPVEDLRFRIALGEGDTPFLELHRMGREMGMTHLYMKDEAFNPTGSFKARGMAMAVSRAAELEIEDLVMPTAGNAGGALAAYAARAGMNAHIYMPRSAPHVNQTEVRITGARLILVDGLITDAASRADEDAKEYGWFSVATFKEPYRVEGKKTIGFELAEAFNWELPDVIVYPTGGGTGLVGMWKAFNELEALGWIGPERPRMISVQALGCAPVVYAIQHNLPRMKPWPDPQTIAPGIQVPMAFADRMILSTIRESGGTAVAVSDQAIMQAQDQLAQLEGIFGGPETAASLAGLKVLLHDELIDPSERVVVFNTATGLKYT